MFSKRNKFCGPKRDFCADFLKSETVRDGWNCLSDCYFRSDCYPLCKNCKDQFELWSLCSSISTYAYQDSEILRDQWSLLTPSTSAHIERLKKLQGETPPIFIKSEESGAEAYIFNNLSVNGTQKRLIIGFRGTEISWRDIRTDLDIIKVPFDSYLHQNEDDGSVKTKNYSKIDGHLENQKTETAHRGFLNQYQKLMMEQDADGRDIEIVKKIIKKLLVSKNNSYDFEVIVTGHSLGGALALLCARHISKFPADFELDPQKFDSKKQLQCITFGAPKVGNDEMRGRFEEQIPKTYQFRNRLDPVPSILSSVGIDPYQHMMPKTSPGNPYQKSPSRVPPFCSFDPNEQYPENADIKHSSCLNVFSGSLTRFFPCVFPWLYSAVAFKSHAMSVYDYNLQEQVGKYLAEKLENHKDSSGYSSGSSLD